MGQLGTATSVQFSSVAQSCPTLWSRVLQHTRPPCPSPTPGVYSNSCPLSQWCHPTTSSLLLLPSILPIIRVFSNELFASDAHSIWVSASTSVLPMNIQDWFPLGWTSWISLQSKELSRFFINTTIQSINFSALSFLYSSTLTLIYIMYQYWLIIYSIRTILM